MPWSMPLPPMQPTQEDIEMHRKAERIVEALEKDKERQRLRDQFAAAALTGLLASMQKNAYAEEAASHAYEIADVMLAERERH